MLALKNYLDKSYIIRVGTQIPLFIVIKTSVNCDDLPCGEFNNIIKKWNDGDGASDAELIAIHLFYSRLEEGLRMLTPHYYLALQAVIHEKDAVENCLWARFPEAMPRLVESKE